MPPAIFVHDGTFYNGFKQGFFSGGICQNEFQGPFFHSTSIAFKFSIKIWENSGTFLKRKETTGFKPSILIYCCLPSCERQKDRLKYRICLIMPASWDKFISLGWHQLIDQWGTLIFFLNHRMKRLNPGLSAFKVGDCTTDLQPSLPTQLFSFKKYMRGPFKLHKIP